MSTINITDANNELESILERIKLLTGAKNDADLHRELDCSPSSIPTWRKRGTVPYSTFIAFAKKKGASIDWLLTGVGPRYVIEWGEALGERMVLEVREKPATFGDRLKLLKSASELIMHVTQEHELDIDPNKDAEVLAFVYHYNLDANGVLQLLQLLAIGSHGKRRGDE